MKKLLTVGLFLAGVVANAGGSVYLDQGPTSEGENGYYGAWHSATCGLPLGCVLDNFWGYSSWFSGSDSCEDEQSVPGADVYCQSIFELEDCMEEDWDYYVVTTAVDGETPLYEATPLECGEEPEGDGGGGQET